MIKKIILLLIILGQIIGYLFLLSAIYFRYKSPTLEGELVFGVGIGLLYCTGFLFFSSLIALFAKKYISKNIYRYFIIIFVLTSMLYLCFAIYIYFLITDDIDKCLDSSSSLVPSLDPYSPKTNWFLKEFWQTSDILKPYIQFIIEPFVILRNQ